MRSDLSIISELVHSDSRVLDLGCGDGSLLAHLQQQSITGYGLEIDQDKITACLAKGVHVIEQNLNSGLSTFNDKSFDTVIMTQALQAVERPDELLKDMVRVGKEAIITFPNFAHWRTRWYLLTRGRMPVSKTLPYNWYDTPNIHLCTFDDFEALCQQLELRIIKRMVTNTAHKKSRFHKRLGNWFGEIAIYHLSD